MTVLTYKELPNTNKIYLDIVKATVTSAKPGLRSATIPRIEATHKGYVADQNHLERYNQVCGFDAGDALPITFPHIAAAPLQMAVLAHSKSPVKMIGLVHVRNSIKQYRAIQPKESMDIYCWIDGQRRVDAGVEFDVMTQIKVGEELVWEEVSTNLSRFGSGNKKKKKSETEQPFDHYISIDVPEGIGRRYGAVSGDRNPIHLYDMTAKLLGFNKAIAHGMWSLARIAAELSPMQPEAQQLDVSFKLPIFLPACVLLRHYQHADATMFKLLSGNGQKPHAVGQIVAL